MLVFSLSDIYNNLKSFQLTDKQKKILEISNLETSGSTIQQYKIADFFCFPHNACITGGFDDG